MPKNLYLKKMKSSLCRQKYTGVSFSIAFSCSILDLSIENIQKNWDKTVLKMSFIILKKNAFFFCLKCTFLIWDHIFKTVLSQLFFLIFLCLGPKWNTKKAIENKTPEYFCLHHVFKKKSYPFWGIFAALLPRF